MNFWIEIVINKIVNDFISIRNKFTNIFLEESLFIPLVTNLKFLIILIFCREKKCYFNKITVLKTKK